MIKQTVLVKTLMFLLLTSCVVFGLVIPVSATSDLSIIDDIVKTGYDKYIDWEETEGTNGAVLMLADWLEQQSEVANVSQYNTDIVIEFEGGYRLTMILRGDDYYSGGSIGDSSGYQSSAGYSLSDPPTSCKAAVLDVVLHQGFPPGTAPSVQGSLETAGYDVTYRHDTEVSLNWLTTLDENKFGVVFLRSHGSIEPADDKLYIMAGDQFTTPPGPSGFVGTTVWFMGGIYYYAFNDDFIRTYVSDAQFPNTIWHNLVCYSAAPEADDDMIDAFLDNGVYVWTGWTLTASVSHGDPAAMLFFQRMSAGDTVGEAINAIEAAGHSPDPGTGAVLRAVPSAHSDATFGVTPIERGLRWLRCHQNPDGSWTYSGRITEENVGLTSIATLSFLNHGIDESDPTVRKAIDWILSKQNPDGSITQGTYDAYDTSLATLALVATRNDGYYDEIQSATNFMISIQNDEDTGYSESDMYYGGWPYWKGMANWADLSNSQFVMLALHYAEELTPTTVPAEVWDKAEIFVTRCQNREASNPNYNFYDDGGFIYQPSSTIWGGGQSYASITAAGLWGFSTCGVSETDGRVQDAWGWIQNNYYVDQNHPLGNLFLYYYLYGLAKACILWNVEEINGHNWYDEMSDVLVNNQQADGHWLGTDPYEEPDNVATCWALLALISKQIPPGAGLNFEVDSPADLHVYDPEGRHVGINYDTGLVEIEIPGATYSGPETEPQIINIPSPIAGTYTTKLVGRESGTYTYTVQGLIDTRVVSEESFTGYITPDEVHESTSIVSALAGAITVETNAIPIANANGPYTGFVESPITFDGTGSYDLDGSIVSYEWDLDNGGEFDDATGPTPSKTWDVPYSGTISLRVTDDNGATDVDTTTLTVKIPVTVDFDPDTLNKKSEGKWVTVYTELPAEYNVTDINVSTVMHNEIVPAELQPTEVGDYDSDGILDLMVKFDRQAVIDILPIGDEVKITVTGKLVDGALFEGSDTIRVIDKGKGK